MSAVLRLWSPVRCHSMHQKAHAATTVVGRSQSDSTIQKVFVVNLDKRTERMAFLQSQLERCGFDAKLVERVSAVEGAKLNPSTLHRQGFLSALGLKRVRRPEKERIWGMDLNPGGLGCAMSHIRLWTRIAQERLKCAMIVEDDSLFPPTDTASFAAQYHERMQHVPDDWQLVYLSGLDTANEAPKLRVASGVSRVPVMHRTTNCYIISEQGARSLLERCVPFTYQLDTQMSMTMTARDATTGVMYSVSPSVCYTLQPPLVVQTTRFGSDIQPYSQMDPAQEEQSRCAAAGWSLHK